MRFVRVAHADAAAVAGVEGEGGDVADSGMLSPLEDGDKPEYIQRADEQVRFCFACPLHPLLLFAVPSPL